MITREHAELFAAAIEIASLDMLQPGWVPNDKRLVDRAQFERLVRAANAVLQSQGLSQIPKFRAPPTIQELLGSQCAGPILYE